MVALDRDVGGLFFLRRRRRRAEVAGCESAALVGWDPGGPGAELVGFGEVVGLSRWWGRGCVVVLGLNCEGDGGVGGWWVDGSVSGCGRSELVEGEGGEDDAAPGLEEEGHG